MIRVTRRFEFAAAHYLPDHKGLCKNMHGHNYVLEVTVEGEIGVGGMVVDFTDLKLQVRDVLANLDHKVVNDVMESYAMSGAPTAENMIGWIWDEIVKVFGDQVPSPKYWLYNLRLYETPNCWVEL